MTTREIAALMRKLSIALEKLPSDQIERLLADEMQLNISLTPVKTLKVKDSAGFDPASYLGRLSAVSDRPEGALVLQGLTRSDLQLLAKRINLSVDSSMVKERLIDRIVERVVGLRLRQDAFAQIT